MTKKFSLKLLISSVTAAAVLSACSIFENDNRFEPSDLTSYDFKVEGHEIWSADIGSGGSPGFAPVVIGDNVFAATPSGDVAKVDLRSGKTIWTVDLDRDLSGGVASDGQVVIVNTRRGAVIALNAQDGKEVWKTEPSTLSSTPAVISQNLVIVRADDYRVQAFDKATGERQWSYLRTNAPMALRGNTRLLAVQNILLAPVPIGRLLALNVENGQKIWDLPASPIQGMSDLDVVTDVVGTPVFSDQKLCLNTYQGNASCYTFEGTGQPEALWSKKFSSSVGLASAGPVLYGASVHGELTAFNAQNGDIQWQDSTLYNRGLTNPVLYKGLIYVGDYEGYVHFYDAKEGKLLGRMEVEDNDPIQSELTVTPYGVLVQTGDGSLELLEAR